MFDMSLAIVSLVHTVAMFNMWKLVRINQIARKITILEMLTALIDRGVVTYLYVRQWVKENSH